MSTTPLVHPGTSTAILLATTAHEPASCALGPFTPLLPLVGKPLLQRAVERLADHGCRHIHVVLDDEGTAIRSFLQDGERWGCRFSYHRLGEAELFSQLMRRLDLAASSHYWLADALRVPVGPLPATPTLPLWGQPLCWKDFGGSHWSGWGCFSGAWLLEQTVAAGRAALAQQVGQDSRLRRHGIDAPLSGATLAAWLVSSRRLLDHADSGTSAHAASRRIHPSARFIAPYTIGRHVKIGADVVVGPHAVIESGAYIDRGTHLRDCVVLPDTYVGKELELDGIIARGRRLAHIALNTVTDIADTTLLAELPPPALPAKPLQRLLAAVQWALPPRHGWPRLRLGRRKPA